MLLATCGGDVVNIYERQDGSGGLRLQREVRQHSGSVHGLAWNHNNQVIASCGEDGLLALVHETGSLLDTIKPPPVSAGVSAGALYAVAFHSKSRFLLTGGASGRADMWDLKKKSQIRSFKGHSGSVKCLKFDSKDENVVSGSKSGRLLLHNVRSGAMVRQFQAGGGRSQAGCGAISFSAHVPEVVASAHADGSVCLWDVTAERDGGCLMTWTSAHEGAATGVAFSPDMEHIVATSGLDGKILFLDTRDRSQNRPRSTECDEPLTGGLSFHHEGVIIAAGGGGGNVYLYDIRSLHVPYSKVDAHPGCEVECVHWQNAPREKDRGRSVSSRTPGGNSNSGLYTPLPTPVALRTPPVSVTNRASTRKVPPVDHPEGISKLTQDNSKLTQDNSKFTQDPPVSVLSQENTRRVPPVPPEIDNPERASKLTQDSSKFTQEKRPEANSKLTVENSKFTTHEKKNVDVVIPVAQKEVIHDNKDTGVSKAPALEKKLSAGSMRIASPGANGTSSSSINTTSRRPESPGQPLNQYAPPSPQLPPPPSRIPPSNNDLPPPAPDRRSSNIGNTALNMKRTNSNGSLHSPSVNTRESEVSSGSLGSIPQPPTPSQPPGNENKLEVSSREKKSSLQPENPHTRTDENLHSTNENLHLRVALERHVVRDAVEEAVSVLRESVREDIRDLHMDLLRQFQDQQEELAVLLECHMGKVAALVHENKVLRQENDELRRLY